MTATLTPTPPRPPLPISLVLPSWGPSEVVVSTQFYRIDYKAQEWGATRSQGSLEALLPASGAHRRTPEPCRASSACHWGNEGPERWSFWPKGTQVGEGDRIPNRLTLRPESSPSPTVPDPVTSPHTWPHTPPPHFREEKDLSEHHPVEQQPRV